MVHNIEGSRLNPSILEKQEDKISNFIENVIFSNYDGETRWTVSIEITFHYCRIVKNCAQFCSNICDKNVVIMKNMNEGFVSFSFKVFINQANNEIDYLKRW